MLASNKEAWDAKFIDFLGITDERVRIICENDYAVASNKSVKYKVNIGMHKRAKSYGSVTIFDH